MREGDLVRIKGKPAPDKIGIVNRVSNLNIEVIWSMGSGWKHIAEHDSTDLEGI